MTDVTSAGRGNAATARSARAPHRAAPPTEDVRAMGEAFARARGPVAEQHQPQPLPGRTGKEARAGVRIGREPDAASLAAWRGADERALFDRREGERHGDQGFGTMAQQAPAAPLVMQAPAPHIDPSGFAQMLADLWTRDNGRGPREIRVRFGRDTWPTTGALLVRSADGVLDVTVEVAAGGEMPSLPELKHALGDHGLTVGSITATAA